MRPKAGPWYQRLGSDSPRLLTCTQKRLGVLLAVQFRVWDYALACYALLCVNRTPQDQWEIYNKHNKRYNYGSFMKNHGWYSTKQLTLLGLITNITQSHGNEDRNLDIIHTSVTKYDYKRSTHHIQFHLWLQNLCCRLTYPGINQSSL